MKYSIDFGNGILREGFDSIKEAKKYAEEDAGYTRENIYIRDEYKEVVAMMPWFDVPPEEDDEVLVNFKTGFYGDWWT